MAKKNHKNTMEKPIKKYLELLYMTPMLITVKEIATILNDIKGIKLELWEEMNVLEIELPNLNSVDLESIEVDFKDPSDAAFVKNRSIKTIFAITLQSEDLNTVKEYFHKIVEHYSGFLCTDSQDFSPVHVGTINTKA